jgi:hypothetical protein
MQLSIRDVVFEVFRFLWENRLDLLRMVAAPVLALSICSILISLMLTSEPPADPKAPSPSHVFANLLSYALQLIFYVMFAVAWHRRCLRSEEQTTILSALKWDRRKTIFLARFFVILLIMVAASLPPALIAAIVGGGTSMGLAAGGVGGSSTGPMVVDVVKALLIVLMLLLQARLALWLPAAALDHKMTLMEAWVIGRRNSWRLVAIFLLSAAPIMLAAILVGSAISALAGISGLAGTITFRFIATLTLLFVYYIVIAASVSALSISYRELRRRPPPGTPYYV